MVNETKNMSSMREKTHQGVDTMMDKAENMEERSKETLDRLKEKTHMLKERVDGHIREHPEKSVLIAAGIGIAAGAIIVSILMRKK